MRKSILAMMAVVPLISACNSTTVNRNESCIPIKWGDVVQETPLDPGFKLYFVTKARCFDMRDQQFPDPEQMDGQESIQMTAQTNDPLTVTGDVTVVYRIRAGSALEVYDTKGTEEALEQELYAAIREGYRNGIVQYSVDELFSGRRTELDGQVQGFIQNKIGRDGLVEIVSVFIRDITAPPEIERLRTQAASRDQMLDQERKQFQVDSIAALRTVMVATAKADSVRLTAQAFNENPALLELRATEAFAEGLGRICEGVQSCIVGGNVLDRYLAGLGGR